MFAYILMRVSERLSNMLARTHAYTHTHVARDDRLDAGVQGKERGSGSSADESDKESRCPRPAGQRGVECVV